MVVVSARAELAGMAAGSVRGHGLAGVTGARPQRAYGAWATTFYDLYAPKLVERLSEKVLSNVPKVDSDVMRKAQWVEKSLPGGP